MSWTHFPDCGATAAWLQAHAPVGADPARLLAKMVDAGLDRLPLPGAGATLARWRVLAAVAAHDLALVKLYEGHTDALAILAELQGGAPAPGERWAVWAAEPPDARLTLARVAGDRIVLDGRKAWCSGAHAVERALVTAWDSAGAQCLAAVELRAPGVTVTDGGWTAVGMAATRSVDVLFDGVAAVQVGAPGAYVARAGFWQGGAGIAACWHGAAAAVGALLRRAVARRDEPQAAAHLGAADATLAASAALLRETAARIDAQPRADVRIEVLRVRAVADRAAGEVLAHATRALGAAPLCRDPWFARIAADLPVFVRQCHAERDLAALARLVAAGDRAEQADSVHAAGTFSAWQL